MGSDEEDGGTLELTGLPVGADCTVTEPEKGSPGDDVTVSTTITPSATVKIEEGSQTVTVTNTYSQEGQEPTGSLEVVKVIEDEDDAAGARTGDVVIDVVCTLEGEQDAVASDTLTVGSDEEDGGTLELTGLPVGADCSVDEPEDGSPGEDVTVSTTITPSATVKIEEGSQTVTVTNTYTEESGPPFTPPGPPDSAPPVDEDALSDADEVTEPESGETAGIVEQPTPPTTGPPVETPAASPASLPRTGVDSTMLAGIGLASLLAGFGLMRSGRREELA